MIFFNSWLKDNNGEIRNFLIIACLRLLTGIIQFTLILLLAAEMSLVDYGTYTLFAIYINYFILIAGFGFHTYTIREMGRQDRIYWPNLLFQSGSFVLMNGSIVILITSLLHYLNYDSSEFFLYFLIILTLSVINNQIENFVVGAGYPVQSAISLFLRSVWIFPLSILVWFYDFNLSLNYIFIGWIASELTAVIYLLSKLYDLHLMPILPILVNYKWIVVGWCVGARYTLLGFLFIVSITVQRVLLGEMRSKEEVGVFQFFFALCVFLPNLIEASIFAIRLPKLIKENSKAVSGTLIPPKFKFSLFFISIVILCQVIVYFALPTLLFSLGMERLTEFKEVFIYIAIYSFLYFSARLFHYQLYSAGKDVFLTYSNIVTFVVAILSSFLFIPSFGVIGAAFSLISTSLAMLVMCSLPFFVQFKSLK
jgi:O-antigen/teichoic acid export membrane protein